MSATNVPAVVLPRTTKGKRPVFFSEPAIDQMMTFIIELTTEVAVLRERLDTVEHLLETQGSVTQEAIEAYHPDQDADAKRTAWRDGYLKRVFRLHPSGK